MQGMHLQIDQQCSHQAQYLSTFLSQFNQVQQLDQHHRLQKGVDFRYSACQRFQNPLKSIDDVFRNTGVLS